MGSAAVHDEQLCRNPAGLLFRHAFQERLRQLFPPRSRVVDLGCGTGEDALFLAAAGAFVHAIDPAPAMIARAAEKARERGLTSERLRFEVRAAEDIGPWRDLDGAYSDSGALNDADLGAVGRALTRALRPGAPVLLGFTGRRPLPAMLRRALTGQGEARGRSQPRAADIPVPARYPGLREARARLGPGFAWRDAFALGVLVPAPPHAAWAERHPQAFGVLVALDGIVRRWPLLRALGDQFVIEGVRR